MIKKIKIKGFQSWKELEVNLSPGVNIFVGESDSGKSAIIRSLRWLFTNRPTGDFFRNNKLKKKEITSVSAILSPTDAEVIRERSSTKNQYRIIDKGAEQILKALRSDIPDEVQKITQIKSTNLQPQHEQYFLLDQSPGTVSKALNKVANLDMMDKALTVANQSIRTNKANLETAQGTVIKLTEEVKELGWVDKAQKRIKRINRKKEQLSLLESKASQIKININTIELKKKVGSQLRPARTALKYLPKYINSWAECVSTQTNIIEPLKKAIKIVNIVDKQVQELYWDPKSETVLKSIISEAKAHPEKVWEKDRLSTLLEKIESNKDFTQGAAEYGKKCREVFDHKLKECGKCPLCGGDV